MLMKQQYTTEARETLEMNSVRGILNSMKRTMFSYLYYYLLHNSNDSNKYFYFLGKIIFTYQHM